MEPNQALENIRRSLHDLAQPLAAVTVVYSRFCKKR